MGICSSSSSSNAKGFSNKVSSKRSLRSKDTVINRHLQTKKEMQEILVKKKQEKHTNDKPPEYLLLNLATSQQKIKKVYAFEKKVIGEGTMGKVRVALLRHDGRNKYAVKTVCKEDLEGHFEFILQELDILRQVDHPNIVFFYESYQSDKKFHFVEELCLGGTLNERIKKQIVPMHETQIKNIVFQALRALSYLHNIGIAHRDIKPQNFIFSDKSQDSEINLADFGLSIRCTEESLSDPVGTFKYVAPEVISGKYDFRCDNWSLGVVLYLLLVDSLPFQGNTTEELCQQIMSNDFNMNGPEFYKVSQEAKDVLRGLMEPDVSQRLTAQKALEMKWFSQITIELSELGKKRLNSQLVERLHKSKKRSLLKKTLYIMMAQIIEYPDEIEELKAAFFYMDYLNTGVITPSEMKTFFKERGTIMKEEEAQEIITSASLMDKSSLSFHEFIAATADPDHFYGKDGLELAFNRFDVDQTGQISQDNLKECFQRFGYRMGKHKIEKIIGEVDKENKGFITKDVFIQHMQEDGK